MDDSAKSSPAGANPSGANRWRRFADWDERPLRLDRFAVEDAKNGFSAFKSPNDPKPGLEIEGGRVVSLDGKAEADFDMIDLFIARHHIDPEIAPKAMAMPSGVLARMLVDFNIPRTELTRLAHGLTPAKLAEVVAQLNAMEIAFAYSKMRARKTPGNQGHVTNAKDDPLQLAADAATAVAFGFDEIETTQRVARKRLVQRPRLRRRRRGRPLGHALPVLLGGSRGIADRHGRLLLLRRDGLGLRHRTRLHRRRRHALVQGLPRRRLCLARHQDALHLGGGLRAAHGLP